MKISFLRNKIYNFGQLLICERVYHALLYCTDLWIYTNNTFTVMASCTVYIQCMHVQYTYAITCNLQRISVSISRSHRCCATGRNSWYVNRPIGDASEQVSKTIPEWHSIACIGVLKVMHGNAIGDVIRLPLDSLYLPDIIVCGGPHPTHCVWRCLQGYVDGFPLSPRLHSGWRTNSWPLMAMPSGML